MIKAPPRSVVFDADILETVLKFSIKEFPNEVGCFLSGEKKAGMRYIVDGYYRPPSESTPDSWSWYPKDHNKAVRWAAALGENNGLIGMAHSHPRNKPLLSDIEHSYADYTLQKDCRFDISLIINVWRKQDELRAWFTVWHIDVNFSLDVLVQDKKKIYSLLQWARQAGKNNSIWQTVTRQV